MTGFIASCFFFFFKQSTAYEMLISDWISDVCSSDLQAEQAADAGGQPRVRLGRGGPAPLVEPAQYHQVGALQPRFEQAPDEQARMPAIGGAHARLRQYLPQHRGKIGRVDQRRPVDACRSEEHTSELQSLMRISYAVFFLKKKHKT